MSRLTLRQILVASSLAAALGAAVPKSPPQAERPQKPTDMGQVVTLSAVDEVSASFSFDSGAHTSSLSDSQLILDSAEIVYGLLSETGDQISYGFVRKQRVRWIDLTDLQVPGYPRTQDNSPRPNISAFHTLFRQGAKFFYRLPNDKVEQVKEAEHLLLSMPAEQTRHFTPEVGHLYVMRFAKQGTLERDHLFIKLRVLDHEPGRFVTIRWAPIPTQKI